MITDLSYVASPEHVSVYGVDWEIHFSLRHLGDGATAFRLSAYDDAWAPLLAETDILAALIAERPETAPALVALLDRLGATPLRPGRRERLLHHIGSGR